MAPATRSSRSTSPADHRAPVSPTSCCGQPSSLSSPAATTRAWLAVVVRNARARAFYERIGCRDDGSFGDPTEGPNGPIPVPCHRYKALSPTPLRAVVPGRSTLIARRANRSRSRASTIRGGSPYQGVLPVETDVVRKLVTSCPWLMDVLATVRADGDASACSAGRCQRRPQPRVRHLVRPQRATRCPLRRRRCQGRRSSVLRPGAALPVAGARRRRCARAAPAGRYLGPQEPRGGAPVVPATLRPGRRATDVARRRRGDVARNRNHGGGPADGDWRRRDPGSARPPGPHQGGVPAQPTAGQQGRVSRGGSAGPRVAQRRSGQQTGARRGRVNGGENSRRMLSPRGSRTAEPPSRDQPSGRKMYWSPACITSFSPS